MADCPKHVCWWLNEKQDGLHLFRDTDFAEFAVPLKCSELQRLNNFQLNPLNPVNSQEVMEIKSMLDKLSLGLNSEGSCY